MFFLDAVRSVSLRVENEVSTILANSIRVYISVQILHTTETHSGLGWNSGWSERASLKTRLHTESRNGIYNSDSAVLQPFHICVKWNLYFNLDLLLEKPLEWLQCTDCYKSYASCYGNVRAPSRNVCTREGPNNIIYKDWLCLQEETAMLAWKKTSKVSSGS